MPITTEEYLSKRGNLKHSWKTHVRCMSAEGKSWVTYSSFRHRIYNQHWGLYRAIHTPADERHRDKDRRRKVWLHNIIYRVKKFFRNIFNLGGKHRH